MIVTMFGADDSQLAVLRASGAINPADHELPAVDLGGISVLALVTLDAAVTGASAVAIQDAVLGQPLEVIDGGEQLLFAARTELADALRTGSPDLADQAGATWAATEEMELDRWQPEECSRVITNLRRLVSELPSDAQLYTFLSA